MKTYDLKKSCFVNRNRGGAREGRPDEMAWWWVLREEASAAAEPAAESSEEATERPLLGTTREGTQGVRKRTLRRPGMGRWVAAPGGGGAIDRKREYALRILRETLNR